jgi:predicted permease
MLNAFGSVFSVITMIGIGLVLSKRGWFDANAGSMISRIVITISLPAYMISNLVGGYDRATLLSMLPGLPIPFLAMGTAFLVAMAIAIVFNVRRDRRGTFASMFSLSNTIFIGLPVNLILFGDSSLSFVLLYYIANTILFWTIGVYGIARDGAIIAGERAPALVSSEGLRRILSPPFLGLLAAVTLIMLQVRLPRVALDFFRTIGAMTTPLSMLFIGIVISRVDWRGFRLERDLILVVLGRFIVAPLILILMIRWANLPLLMKQVFLVQSMMPVMTQTPILVGAHGADAEYAGIATSLSTVLSLAVIPLCMALAGVVFS